MAIVTYSYARQNLAELMDEADRDRTPIFITRQRKKGGVVLVSLEEYEAMEATLHLLSNPNNARALRESIAALDAGSGIEHDLVLAKPRTRSK